MGVAISHPGGFAGPNLTQADARDFALYLKTLTPVHHKGPGPFGPGQAPSILVLQIVPGPVYAASEKTMAQCADAAGVKGALSRINPSELIHASSGDSA